MPTQSVAVADDAYLSTTNPEFLAALPDDIREEVLAQERQQREREERARRQTTEPTAAPAEVDVASMVAMLTPELRQEILRDNCLIYI